MPWLIGTAFLHSIMVQEKKGMLKVWNMVLVILAYILCIFGTFLTRSGVVSSVHAFAQSNIGGYFLAFILIGLAGSFYLLFDRLKYLKADNQLESVVSRESSFLFNNLVLLLACFAVFWGTMFPVLSEAAPKWLGGGEKITVSAPFFNSVNVPIAIFLLFLTGVGPLLAWRKTSANSLKRAFMTPGLIALAGGAVLYIRGMRHFYAWMSLVMTIFVAVSILSEFYRGAIARGSSSGENFFEAVVNLTLRNTRRYGGYIVHFGFVLLFIGWAGQAFTDNYQFEGGVGDTIPFHQYVFRIDKLGREDNPNYSSSKASVSLFENDRNVAIMYPEQRIYKASQQPSTEVSIRSTAREDVYLVFAGATPDGTKAIFQVFINPLTMWVWFGGVVLGLGTLIAMLPNKKSGPTKRGRRSRRVPSQETPEGREVQVGIS